MMPAGLIQSCPKCGACAPQKYYCGGGYHRRWPCLCADNNEASPHVEVRCGVCSFRWLEATKDGGPVELVVRLTKDQDAVWTARCPDLNVVVTEMTVAECLKRLSERLEPILDHPPSDSPGRCTQ